MEGSERLNYFRGVPRQRGRGLGALAGSIARTAFPIFRKYVLPVAKKIGRDVIESAIPEIDQVLKGNSSIKKAVKKTAKRTARKQIGGGRKKKTNRSKKKKRIIHSKVGKQRSRDDFFKNVA